MSFLCVENIVVVGIIDSIQWQSHDVLVVPPIKGLRIVNGNDVDRIQYTRGGQIISTRGHMKI